MQHVRAHTGLPGPISNANAEVDEATQREFVFPSLTEIPVNLAKQFHANFHVNANTLQLKFGISREAARQIVVHCPDCSVHHNPPGTELILKACSLFTFGK